MENKLTLSNEPIAIVGIGCRFPGGAASPEEFWQLLADGTDCIVDVPKDRWDYRRFYDPDTDKPGKSHQFQGGFLKLKLDEFDPLFFGMSPREAAVLDPQQRLLLETTWEAVEDAGFTDLRMKGSDTGVFVGGFCFDNKLQQLSGLNRDLIGPHTATSSTMVMLSNRISYAFDLRGPSLSIDTACSSALVAAHYACMSIWAGESEMAIAGGVNIMLRPEYPIAMSKGQFLSKHSRCKAFDEDAGGYVRGEGAGVVVLKPLSKAIADKDFVYACIRATGSNQDGATNGITVPNPDAQEALIRKVYAQAGITAKDIVYVEAHGTGTKAGDPVEVTALNNVLSEGRGEGEKVFVGSVKTNIGHLEAGAGIAGMIKSALSLNKRFIPPHLHFKKANPKIDFERLALKVPLELTPYPPQKAMVSINSFGYGGTNGHMVVEEPPRDYLASIAPKGEGVLRSQYVFPFSAKSENALKLLCAKHAEFLKNNEVSLTDFAFTLAFRRSHFTQRLSIVAATKAELIEKLAAYSSGELLSQVVQNQTPDKRKMVFVFTGMGPQWWAMGRELYEKEPVFREKLDRCDVLFKSYAGWSLLEEMMKPESESQMNETRVAQPANFFIQAGLFDLWKSWGVSPDAVVGHSVGEVPAAYVSGALSLEDAVLVSYHRSRCQQMTAGQGTMLAVGYGEEDAVSLISSLGLSDTVSVAAINSFSGVTLAGTRASLEKIGEACTAKNVFNKMLTVEVAYHSYQMDPLEGELRRSLGSVHASKASLPLYSTVTGTAMTGEEFGCDYWWQNVRQPVRFAKAAQTIVNDGYTIFVEVGPHPVLRTNLSECLTAADKQGFILPSLRRAEPEVAGMLNSLGTLHTLGCTLNWSLFTEGGTYVKIPTYAWDTDVYWQETPRSIEEKFGIPGHVFINNDLRMPNPSYEVEVNRYFFPWLDDHKIESMVVVPGAAYVEAGLAMHEKVYESQACTLQGLEFYQVFVVDDKKNQMFHTAYNPATRSYSVYSRFREDTSGWTLHAQGRMLKDTVGRQIRSLNPSAIRSRCTQELSAPALYATLASRGLNYGPWFQGIKQIFKGNNEVLVRIQGDDSLMRNSDNYLLHPTILDSGFQTMVAIVEDSSSNPNPFVPVSIDQVVFYTSPGAECWSHCEITSATDSTIKGNLTLFDDQGEILVSLEGITCQAISGSEGSAGAEMDQWFYAYEWNLTEGIGAQAPASGHWLVFGDESDASTDLVSSLAERGVAATLVLKGSSYSNDEVMFTIREGEESDYRRMLEELSGPVSEVVFLWPMESVSGDLIRYEDSMDLCMPAVYLGKSMASLRPQEKIRWTVLTRGAVSVLDTDRCEGLAASPYWGLSRLITNEHPNMVTRTVDMDAFDAEIFAGELLSGSKEDDVAYRVGQRYSRQLKRNPLIEQESLGRRKVNTETPVNLEIGQIGRIDSLHYAEVSRVAPGVGEIEIQTKAACLNLKDVLKVIGQLSQKATSGTYFERTFGMEASGIVTRVGEGVTDFKIGDEIVLAAQNGCLRSYVTATPTFYLRKPSKIKWEDCLMVVPYMTVIYGLRDRAQLAAGERILIHNATGGVGLAAIQWAKHVGAEVFATAGSEEKREHLRSLGVKHVYDSRSLEFASRIKEATNGEGVDVVLNAIAGEALTLSFDLLASYGRFVEIGKRDISENNGLPMAAFNRNITFHGIDVDRLMIERTSKVQAILRDIEGYYASGVFSEVKTYLFPAAEAQDAFTFLAQSKHMGKVVLDFHNQEVEVAIRRDKKALETEATYLITGGTGGFGLQIAGWLSSKGVKQLVLASRSGARSEEAKEAIAFMEAQGTKIWAEPLDITDYSAVEKAIAHISATMLPLKGIIHGAVVLDDGFLVDMNRERFDTSFKAKVGGALNLHKATRAMDLDYFISFSSISALIGNNGQANYVAANAFLDGFAQYRRANGMAATTINLGVLGEVGVAARDANVTAILASGGIIGFSTQQALDALGVVMEHNPVQLGMFDVDWVRWASVNTTAAQGSRFKALAGSEGAGEGGNAALNALAKDLSVLSDPERRMYMEQATAEELARVLKLSVEKVDKSRGINFLGIDSLMAVELGRAIQARFGVEVSTMELLSGPTAIQLAALLLEKAIATGAIVSDLEDLSEEEIDALLAAEAK
jgi:acyl transferase domain-containing protein/NAD(P)-dependent dehydrogenase (short-subunit alcohol dehydrogenase family)/acyl carrier protein